MPTRAEIYPRVEEERYLALLRAASAIANSDCSDAFDTLTARLRDVTPFDYLHLVAFDDGTKNPAWQLFEASGKRLDVPREAAVSFEGTPIARVYESGELLVTDDWNHETQFQQHQSFLTDLGISSTCTLPLKRGERRLGVLTLGRFYPNAYDDEEVRFLCLVADQIGLAIDAALNFCVSQRVKDQLKLILDLNNQVVSNLDFNEFLHVTSSSVRQVMRCEAAAVMLADAEGKHLRIHALDFPESRGVFTEGTLVPIEGTLPGDAFRTGKPIVVNRLNPAELPPEMYRKAIGEGLNSFCDVPLISKNRMLGVLAVARREENAFDEDEVAFLTQVAKQVAIGVENVGQSSALRHVLQLVETVAPSDSTVLLLGETGTGKELIARAIHDRSRRKQRTFVKLNCAAIPTGLLESELFGHERGAFTGAITQKLGRLELADQGTLFLDEVGDIPIEIQPKLLRALQEREFERLGSTRTKKVDVRLVAATNRDLEKMIETREFRSDLYYRLNVFPIRIPPLRERPEDIPLLVRYFAQKYGRRMEKQVESVPAAAMKKLATWHWPGNIRELENFIERSVILTHGSALQVPISELTNGAKGIPPLATRDASERDEILRVLKGARGKVGGPEGAAARLGLKRTTLISRMNKLGINSRQLS